MYSMVGAMAIVRRCNIRSLLSGEVFMASSSQACFESGCMMRRILAGEIPEIVLKKGELRDHEFCQSLDEADSTHGCQKRIAVVTYTIHE